MSVLPAVDVGTLLNIGRVTLAAVVCREEIASLLPNIHRSLLHDALCARNANSEKRKAVGEVSLPRKQHTHDSRWKSVWMGKQGPSPCSLGG